MNKFHRTDQKHIYLVVRMVSTHGEHNGHDGCRGPDGPRLVTFKLESGKQGVGCHVNDSPSNSPKEIHSREFLAGERVLKDRTEPVQPEHIEQQV